MAANLSKDPAAKLLLQSVWMESRLPRFPKLTHDIDVDVVIVGGGLTGITTAYLLRKEGVRVALIERARVAASDTGKTTAHLTYVTDYRLHDLVSRFGEDGAKAFWEAGASAIDTIAGIVRDNSIDCDFRWAPGYLHAPLGVERNSEQEIAFLQQDAQLAHKLGFDARFVDSVPQLHSPGVRFAGQAKFNPRRYLAPLLQAIQGDDGYIFEETALEAVEEKPFTVRANGKRIRCEYLVIATHNPLMGRKNALSATLFQTKLSLYTSYVLGARVAGNSWPEALFWDTCDPYNYLRIDSHADHQYVIYGGEDVKTGQEESVAAVFASLEERLRRLIPEADIQHRWMGQVVETDDGLPFIGENADREFIATGFCGNGFTLGTLSATMARDRFLGRKNPWFDLFRVDRRPFHGGLWRYVRENLDYPYYLLRDRMAPPEGDSLEQLAKGEGRILGLDGKKVAAYRDDNGEITLCSPVCTHLKCLVRWNEADRTWDCPCHGSRFHSDGAVMSGPAETALEKIDAAKRERE